MRAGSPFAAVLCCALAFPAWGGPKPEPEKECPHPFGEFDRIEADMAKASSCTAARELLSACAAGGSSDVRIGAAALTRCERDFLPRLNKTRRLAYQAAQDRCERRYSRREGTMYRSALAFCLVEAAEKFVKASRAKQ